MHYLSLPVALLLGFSMAVPMPDTNKSPPYFPWVPVTFNGAGGASYSMSVVANGVPVPTNNDLSVSSISMEGRASFACTSYGKDGSVTHLVASQVLNYAPVIRPSATYLTNPAKTAKCPCGAPTSPGFGGLLGSSAVGPQRSRRVG